LTQELFILFSPPVLLKKGSERVAGQAPRSQSQVTRMADTRDRGSCWCQCYIWKRAV